MFENHSISPGLILGLIFGTFTFAVLPPLGFALIVFGVVQQTRKTRASRRDIRFDRAAAILRAEKARTRALLSI